jgi:hypothetical protein
MPLHCFRLGGRVRHGMVDLASPDALASLTVLLNHVGLRRGWL